MAEKNEIAKQEEEILKYWKDNKTFEKSLEKTRGKKPYIFYDGPPFATGMPHYGHILGSVAKDLFGRFWTMKNRYVRRVWGWDCHGLPIENIAEKELGINSKDEIEKLGIKKFNDFCRSKVLTYADSWKNVVERIGRWVDMENDYKTMDNEYIESVWWAFKQLYEKDFIYKGEKILMYCPRCSTPLSKSEIAMDNSYKTIKEKSIVVKFKLKNEDAYALAWTTTPWTLPSNLALAVNPELKYAYVKDNSDGTTYLIAKNTIKDFFKDESEYETLKELKGKELENSEYEPLFEYFKDRENAFKIILADFVSEEDGTGIVHIAPAFGEDDYEACKKYKISPVQPVDENGHFTNEVKDFSGKYVHEVNDEIIEFLKKQNKTVLIKKSEHEYPFCYRCDTKLIYRAIPAWFVNIQKIKPKLKKISKEINWYPEFLQEGRVKYTIETAPDWNISRNRFWATAMPIWESPDGERLVIGSIDELKKYAKNPLKKIDLHKDKLDEIILVKNKKEFKRIPEVLDCWFESGAMTFAQFHYPFENKKFFEENFPAQFVAEYIAQIRAWFYYMMVFSAILFDGKPFENVVTTGTILAEDGSKMSKSKNNFTDPLILIDKFGVDALRFYLMSSSVMNADNLNFSDAGVEEIYKKVILITQNSLKFYEENSTESKSNLKGQPKNLLDKWIISRLNKFIKDTESYLKNYNTIKASNEIRYFIEDLSTWYIRLNRDRFSEDDEDAKQTLKHVLEQFAKTAAPIIPFITEKIFLSINKKSVHLEEFPKPEKFDEPLLEKMSSTREIVSVGLRERDREQIGLKWPLAKATISTNEPDKLDKQFQEIIKQQLNVKKLEIKKSEETKVELDTHLTKDLEAEGFARNLVRTIQSERKNLGLTKEDKIEVEIISKELPKKIENHTELIAERTNSRKLTILEEESTKKFNHSTESKIKDKKFSLKINTL